LQRFWRIPWRAQFDGTSAFESPLPNPMGLALLVFLPLGILVPSRGTPARRACLLFCAIYLAYWIASIGILRYAVLPVSLLVVLLVGKATKFYDQPAGPLVRASMVTAFAGALLFALLGIAIIEVNAPMLMLLARRIGPEQYLNLALRTHRSLAWLSAAHPRSSVYGVGNCSRAYAPDPGKFYCSGEWNTAKRPWALRQCQYLVLPQNRKPPDNAELLFSDPFFQVWQLR
jgi:hypothetical protein